MTNERALSAPEAQAKRAAQVMAYQAQGYSLAEICEMLGVTRNVINKIVARTKKRIPADDTKQWRQVQLLRYERLYAACEAVLAAHHVVVSNGQIVQQYVMDDEGKPIWDPVCGPDGEHRLDHDGQPMFERRKVALEDHAAVLEAVAEMRKLEVEIAKLLGTPVAVKQAVEVAHVEYTINGVDMGKTLGTDRTQE